MERIDERWPEGIKEFWSGFDKFNNLGEESGFYPETGRLEICRCYNRQLDENILREREHIRELVIRKNELEEESYEIIAQLTNLQKLVLESVGPYILELDVRKLNALTDVRIGSATNTELPDWILKIGNLESLNISNTRIEKFPDYSTYDGYRGWKKLDISYTAIEELPDFKGQKLEQLRELRVANTGIEKIPSCYFTEALRLLDCSSTRISSLGNFSDATNLEVFRCADNPYLKELTGVKISELRVLDVCQCLELQSLPEKGYNKLEVLAVCGNFFDALPLDLLKHCIDHKLLFKQESAKRLRNLSYDEESLLGLTRGMRGVYIEETFFRKMDFRYLLDNDRLFLRYYIDMERQGKLRAKHETKIMVLGDERGVGNLFLQSLVPEHPQLRYMEYGGLKVLDTAAGELDYMRRKLDPDADLSIWTMENGRDEQFMHHIIFGEHDFFVIVFREDEKTNYYEHAVYWLKEMARYIQYATIAFAVVGGSANDAVILSLKEVKQECERKYFRFLNKVYNVNIKEANEYIGLTDWLVEGIREKSNYEMRIPPEWKRLRGEIVSYFDLRRIINQKRFTSLVTLERRQGRKSFVNYLQESKSLFHIKYSEEDYYFKAEWVINALFGLLDVLRKGQLPEPFKLDDLRVYLQIEHMDYLDFFQDSESLHYLMDILEEIGAVSQISGEYYDLMAQSYMLENSHIFKLLSDSVQMTYKIAYSILTEQMALKIIAVLMQEAENIGFVIDEEVFRYKDCIAFKLLERAKSKGYLVAKIITGCPGKIFFYGVADSETGNMKLSAQRSFRENLRSVIRRFLSNSAFSLWQSEVFLLYEANGVEDFVSMALVERYVKAGYASAFLPQYNASIDMDEVYREFGI